MELFVCRFHSHQSSLVQPGVVIDPVEVAIGVNRDVVPLVIN